MDDHLFVNAGEFSSATPAGGQPAFRSLGAKAYGLSGILDRHFHPKQIDPEKGDRLLDPLIQNMPSLLKPKMSDQLSLAGFDPAQKPTDRLFLALIPEAAATGQITGLAHSLRASHGLSGRPLLPSRFHVTLCHIGDYHGLPGHVVAQAMESAARIKRPPFTAEFDRAVSFKGSEAFALVGSDGNTALQEFRLALFQTLKTYGPGCLSGLKFTPHITLLYDGRLVAEHPVEPVRLNVREFILIHSLLGKEQHIHLARWALQG